ncbi:MAG: hypothetical protein JSR28_17740 [Proteobacteria bacterium]|nr:hypothetical protein [Pseudomonadota bacterium]
MSRKSSPAMRRYLKRVFGFMLAYVALIFVVGWTFRHAAPAPPLAYLVAILPALPIIGVFWTIFRLLVEETDEYMRMLFVRQSLFATAFCLTVMTVWEFLQNYDVVPAGNGGFGAAFLWFMGLGFGALWNRLTLGEGGCP